MTDSKTAFVVNPTNATRMASIVGPVQSLANVDVFGILISITNNHALRSLNNLFQPVQNRSLAFDIQTSKPNSCGSENVFRLMHQVRPPWVMLALAAQRTIQAHFATSYAHLTDAFMRRVPAVAIALM